ncbi:ATP-binding cassette domain-containing protein [Aeromicrobium sp.]|uniref:ATP-binding cassette domain-containing protein n=1 Tax=Aeromicrobium sp. TaxID=1871063 RepID=UPI0025BA435F|nr:ATP-binding cassette domain-containing protein [Aeromicrobium sp.]
MRTPTGTLCIDHAARNNLRDVTVDVPLGCLVAITGVAGAGKTSLLACLPRNEKVAVLDQTPIRGSRRSSPATYSGALDDIRAEFAAANNVKANLFSPNSAGACANCAGLGVTFTPTPLGDDVTATCASCQGARFQQEALSHTLRKKTIADVLDMAIETAAGFFSDSPAADILNRLTDVGIGYIHLGQPLTDLSGGERQRRRLAIEMGRQAPVYVLDEPTNGLHLADVDNLVGVCESLIEGGASVIVADHHRDLIARSDWVIDLGHDAGHDGGSVVFEGTPADLTRAKTHTGRALRASHA